MKYIYRVWNTVNGKCYIGASQRPRKRLAFHMCGGSNKLIFEDVKKFGKENFKLEILVECDDDLSDLYEHKYVRKFDSYNNGYNGTKDGKGGCASEDVSVETRRKMSKARIGKTFSVEHRRKLSEVFTGRVHSEETKRKISEAHAGRVFSDEHRRNISEARIGIVFSDETKRRMSESAKRRKGK